jgi:hypothetical protein
MCGNSMVCQSNPLVEKDRVITELFYYEGKKAPFIGEKSTKSAPLF